MITKATSTCLSFGQLRDYALDKSALPERNLQYLHISQCELCACAVNGFTAMPFTLAEVNAIHHQVTVKANAAHANPLIIARVVLAAICVASVFAFYYFAESFSGNNLIAVSEEPVVQNIIVPVVRETEPLKETGETIVLKPGVESPPASEKLDRISIPVNELPAIRPSLDLTPVNSATSARPSNYSSGLIYIYDLKVVDYNGLYFNYRNHNFEIKGHTPSHKETKESPDPLVEDTQEMIPADKVLKAGLAYFSNGNYSKALEQFLLLRENNPKDQNALFYGGLCCYHLGKYRAAILSFETILEERSAFDEESKWNLAQSYLGYGDNGKAYALFNEIVAGNSFYSKRAAEKLKSL